MQLRSVLQFEIKLVGRKKGSNFANINVSSVISMALTVAYISLSLTNLTLFANQDIVTV